MHELRTHDENNIKFQIKNTTKTTTARQEQKKKKLERGKKEGREGWGVCFPYDARRLK
jgi:hypothetical protein